MLVGLLKDVEQFGNNLYLLPVTNQNLPEKATSYNYIKLDT